MRPTDRLRVVELTRDVWGGHDYVPRVFDDWVSEAGAAFQAIELEGVVVGVQRLRPYSSGLVWYEGLRVASTHRRQADVRPRQQRQRDQTRDSFRHHGVLRRESRRS